VGSLIWTDVLWSGRGVGPFLGGPRTPPIWSPHIASWDYPATVLTPARKLSRKTPPGTPYTGTPQHPLQGVSAFEIA